MNTIDLQAPYTARNSEKFQPRRVISGAQYQAARITKEREEKAEKARKALAEVHAARLDESWRIATEGTPMERGLHGIEMELLGIAEAHNIDAMYAHYWRMLGMLNAALAFGALSREEVQQLRERQSEAFGIREKQLRGRAEK